MNMRRFQAALHLCLIGVAAVLMYGGAAAAGELSVCIDKASPTADMDRQLAQAVARQEGNLLKVHSFNSDEGGDDGFAPKDFSKLARQHCDLVLGFPVDASEGAVPSGLQATTPYGHTGFVLVTATGSKATTLDSLPGNSKVAVTYLTTPNLYFAEHPKLQADVHLNDGDALKALRTGADQAAMLWQPSVVRYLSGQHAAARFSYHELHEPHAQFNLVALYDPGHAGAAAAFERAIATLAASSELAHLLAPYAEAGSARRPGAEGTEFRLGQGEIPCRRHLHHRLAKHAGSRAGQPDPPGLRGNHGLPVAAERLSGRQQAPDLRGGERVEGDADLPRPVRAVPARGQTNLQDAWAAFWKTTGTSDEAGSTVIDETRQSRAHSGASRVCARLRTRHRAASRGR